MTRMGSGQPPGKAKYGGYLYAIEFSNGTIKVGCTANPLGRLATHEHNAQPFGAKVVDWWVSPLHNGHEETEKKLISIAGQLGGMPTRREFFTGVDFAKLVTRAQKLSFPPVDIAAAKAHEEQNAERIRRSLGLPRDVEDHDPSRSDVMASMIGSLFGRRKNGSYEVPRQQGSEPMPEALLRQLAEATGRSFEDLLEMDFIDLLEGMVATVVRTEALRLRIYARQHGRSDLERTFAETQEIPPS